MKKTIMLVLVVASCIASAYADGSKKDNEKKSKPKTECSEKKKCCPKGVKASACKKK